MHIVPSVYECRDPPFSELIRCCNVLCISPPPPPPPPRNPLTVPVGSERHTSTYPHVPRSAQVCVSQQAFVGSIVLREGEAQGEALLYVTK